ncbi:hypothetical protein FUT87_20530, partial [Mitsuaria sp. TWR114]
MDELFHLSPRGTTARYLLLGTSLQSTGALETLEQQPTGGVVAMNAHTLTGPDLSVADIAGDETFAQGRWAKGTALAAGSTSTLGGARNAAYHYVVHLAATHFPAGGTLRCDAGTFTRPTVISNPSAPALGVATGSAALSFNDAGAWSTCRSPRPPVTAPARCRQPDERSHQALRPSPGTSSARAT